MKAYHSMTVNNTAQKLNTDIKSGLTNDEARSRLREYGLGLAICKSMVTLLEGEINIESIPGELTTFTVSLPSLISLL